MTEHSLIPAAKMHGIVGKYGPFASAALRRAQVLDAGDVGQVSRQTDTDPATVWMVLKVTSGVGTWTRIDTGAEALATGPLAIMSGHVLAGYSGDVGLTSTTWTDQGPGAHHLAGTCSVASAVLGGKNGCQTNGSSHAMSASFAITAPGTTNKYLYTIVRNDTKNSLYCIAALSNLNDMAMLQDSGTGEICLFNSASFGPRHATGLTLSSFKRARALFTGTGTDLVQVGSGTAVTGAAAGNTAGTGIFIGASNSSFAANTYLEVWLFDQDPGGTNLAALDAWASTKYGVSFP